MKKNLIKYIVSVLLFFILCFVFVGCKNAEDKTNNTVKENGNDVNKSAIELIKEGNIHAYAYDYVDTTGVHYLIIYNNRGEISITPRLNSDGTVMIDNQE